ncbi:hypothetical protein HDU86_004025 [Geranomyces michiganensis]|nr:hypothetical protein HDU86_004025 [Geranomyces michiganensis]
MSDTEGRFLIPRSSRARLTVLCVFAFLLLAPSFVASFSFFSASSSSVPHSSVSNSDPPSLNTPGDNDRLSDDEVFHLESLANDAYIYNANLSADARRSLLEKHAPALRLHPRDKWRPADPAAVYELSTIKGDNRTLVMPEESWRGNNVSDAGTISAKIVGQVVQVGPDAKTYLQYWFFYPVNGCQGFRISIWSGLRSFIQERAENFEWCPMAYHNGDWEHITVQLDGTWSGESIDDTPPVRAIAFSQHAGAEWLPASALTFTETHPHVYAALHSHANYATEGTHKNIDDTFGFVSRISPLLTLGAVSWIQIADVADLGSNLFLSEEPWGQRFQRFVIWNTWDDGIYDWTDKSDWRDYARFSGYWGDEIDQTVIAHPPLGVTAGTQLLATTRGAQWLGVLNKFVKKHEKGPKGPRQHRTWYTLDNPPP